MCEQFNCLFESQIALGYSSHHCMAIVLHEEKQNRKTLSTVTPTTFGAAQTQLPCSSVRKVNINVSDTSVCVLEAAAGSVVPPKPAPASICVHSVCVGGGGGGLFASAYTSA